VRFTEIGLMNASFIRHFPARRWGHPIASTTRSPQVPEPATWGLLVAGILMVAALRGAGFGLAAARRRA
jgi:hypothetical protein